MKTRKVAYVDVFRQRDGKTLVIANDERHNELWRRNDPEANRVAYIFKSKGKTPVFDHRDSGRP